jgi:hypothetical protein
MSGEEGKNKRKGKRKAEAEPIEEGEVVKSRGNESELDDAFVGVSSSSIVLPPSSAILTFTQIVPPDAEHIKDIMLREGVTKRLVIIHKLFGGNKLYFYDESFRPILDVFAIYGAQVVYFTNERRDPGVDLSGIRKFDREVTLIGHPSLSNYLRLQYPRGFYEFRDEQSLLVWSANVERIVHAKAYIK